MTQPSHGFFLERISVIGPDVATAEVEFSDGLNIIAGASDTGKSYLCSLVDFVFGSSSLPRPIEQAKRYARVIAHLRDRKQGELYEIERALIGGDATVRQLDARGAALNERIAAAKHSADDPTTLSAFLLGLSGFDPVRVRKSKKETRTLSFRDIAFLIIVDETRIISENPPHLSGSPVEKTVEGEVFRLLVTGIQSVEPIVAPRKTTVQSAKAQLELVQQLVTQVKDEMVALKLDSSSVEDELTLLDQARGDLLKAYESSRVELVALEREVATRNRALNEAASRSVVAEGLSKRFELLDRHYESDIERLSAVEEAGVMLEALPPMVCPVCGAAPEDHRPEQAAEHFRVEDVRLAAVAEQEKIGRLRTDLQRALLELSQESMKLQDQGHRLQEEIRLLQKRISDEVQPRARTSAEQLQGQNARRDLLLRGRVLTEQLQTLEDRAARLEVHGKRESQSIPSIESGPTTAGMESFVQQVQEILSSWHFPDIGRVVFSEDSQDLVVGGQPRVSHGKGVRALSCSAFIAGLMRHCIQKGLAHPGLIVLDSPLVAYKDPDSPGTESARIRLAGVKDAFYQALANGLCLGQVIV